MKLDLRSKRPERFWMHALVAAFALDTLESTEGEDGVREAQQRRLEHYRRVAGAADGGLGMGGDTQYLSAYIVDLDLPCIRAAHSWARSRSPGDRRAAEYLSRLVSQGSRTLADRLGLEEFLEWTLLAEEAAHSTGDQGALKNHRANLGAALLRNGRPEEALPYLKESLEEARASGNAQAEAAALANHAVVYGGRRDYETALGYARQAEAAAGRADSPDVQSGAIGQQAEFLKAFGRTPEAEERLEAQRDLAQEKGELSRYAKALRDLAQIRRDHPDKRDDARRMYGEAAEVFWNLREYANYRSAMNGLGILENEAGFLDAAEEAFQKALDSAVEGEDKGDKARAKMHLGVVHRFRDTEEGVGAAETELWEALPLAA
ncbi:MAG: tetratricopeptide repeat protein, partial [Rubrobacteraceae bacterium]|nr:tetratricopeptide repeat protein [Rubrobacteraceae bacterium]